MLAPSAQTVLTAWETARPKAPSKRADVLLLAAMPQIGSEALANMSLGRRDALLLELRRVLFGSRLSATSACGRCGQSMQMDFDVADILVSYGDACEPAELAVSVADFQCTFRLPRGSDLDAIADSADTSSASNQLLSRCIQTATRQGKPVSIEALDESVRGAVSQAMANADPGADIRLSLVCPHCRHGWSAPFDPLSFLWTELEAWAMRHAARSPQPGAEVRLARGGYSGDESDPPPDLSGDVLRMSDLLSHLAIRATAPQALVRLRVQGLFEPARADAASPAGDAGFVEENVEVSADDGSQAPSGDSMASVHRDETPATAERSQAQVVALHSAALIPRSESSAAQVGADASLVELTAAESRTLSRQPAPGVPSDVIKGVTPTAGRPIVSDQELRTRESSSDVTQPSRTVSKSTGVNDASIEGTMSRDTSIREPDGTNADRSRGRGDASTIEPSAAALAIPASLRDVLSQLAPARRRKRGHYNHRQL